jgi:hypothetical protein
VTPSYHGGSITRASEILTAEQQMIHLQDVDIVSTS